MGQILIAFTVLLFGAVIAFHGVLLVVSPELFFKVIDAMSGGRPGVAKQWRGNIHSVDYKVLGVALSAFGLFAVFSVIRTLIG
jgi:hypothetical protein